MRINGIVLKILISLFLFSSCIRGEKVAITYHVDSSVDNTDPIEFDLSSHHVAFSGVIGTLISQYGKGSIEGILAQSWENKNFKEWRFKIRKGIYFSNGDPITPKTICQNLRRVAYIQKIRNSNSGLLENTLEFDKINNASTVTKGIECDDQEVILSFNKPNQFVLEKISFGLYGIVHPDCFDAVTGNWKDPKFLISSGNYKIHHWSEKSLELKLDGNGYVYGHPKKFKTVTVTWDPEKLSSADLWDGSNRDLNPVPGATFAGNLNTSITYLRFLSKNKPGDLFYKKENRKAFFHYLKKELKGQGLKIPETFFPTMKNLKASEIAESAPSPFKFDKGLLKSLRINDRRRLVDFNEPVFNAVKKFSEEHQLTYERLPISLYQIFSEVTKGTPPYSIDVAMTGSEINIENPYGTIRFMFFSKEGIQLPDEDGSITKILKEENFSVDEINQKIEEQALIWPVAHFSYFFWYRGDFIDFSEYNSTLPPMDFSWIGQK